MHIYLTVVQRLSGCKTIGRPLAFIYSMSAEVKNEKIMFILPEDLKMLKKNKHAPDIEAAIKNVERLQKFTVEKVDNTEDFIRIEMESMENVLRESNVEAALKLLPVFLSDVKKFFGRKK